MLGMGHLYRGRRIVVDHCERVPLGDRELTKAALARGDLLFARRSLKWEGAGVCAIVGDLSEPTVFESSIIRVRVDSTRADPEFLSHFFRGGPGRIAIESIIEQTAVAGIRATDLAALPIVIPPLAEQEAIASVLNALDDKLESNRRLAQALDAAAAALFAHESVVEPSTNPRSARLPAGYVAGRLVDLVSVEMGQSPPGSTYNSVGNGLPLVQGMGSYGERHPTPSLWTTDPRKRVPAGTTLMTVRAPVGAVNVTRVETALGRGVAGITCESRYFAEYLVRSLAGRWHAEEAGTIFPSVNGKQIKDLPLVIPPRELVAAMDKTLKPFVDRIEAVMDETQTLIAIRDALLPKLVSGRIRVPLSDDMEEPIGAAIEALT